MDKETRLKKVFICSPYRPRGETEEEQKARFQENIDIASGACRFAIDQGAVPYAPHLYFTQYLDDEDENEREQGIILGLSWLARCDELWIIGDTVTDGMDREISTAKEWGIPIKRVIVKKKANRAPKKESQDDARIVNLEKEDGARKPQEERTKYRGCVDVEEAKKRFPDIEEIDRALDQEMTEAGLVISMLFKTMSLASLQLPSYFHLTTEYLDVRQDENEFSVSFRRPSPEKDDDMNDGDEREDCGDYESDDDFRDSCDSCDPMDIFNYLSGEEMYDED